MEARNKLKARRERLIERARQVWDAQRAVEAKCLGRTRMSTRCMHSDWAVVEHSRFPFHPFCLLEEWFHEAAHLVLLHGHLSKPYNAYHLIDSWIAETLTERALVHEEPSGMRLMGEITSARGLRYMDEHELMTLAVEIRVMKAFELPLNVRALIRGVLRNDNLSKAFVASLPTRKLGLRAEVHRRMRYPRVARAARKIEAALRSQGLT